MKTVYKYPLVIDDYQKVILPINAKLLCIKEQNGKLCLWALINKEETCTEQITIRCAGTGHPIKENVEYIDSIMMMGGNLVFHFFKIIEMIEYICRYADKVLKIETENEETAKTLAAGFFKVTTSQIIC